MDRPPTFDQKKKKDVEISVKPQTNISITDYNNFFLLYVQVLGFEGVTAHPDEIQPRCRKLSRQYHPDKFKTAAEKLAAQEKFIEIQKACDTLNEMRKRRAEKNMKSDTTKPPPPDRRRSEF